MDNVSDVTLLKGARNFRAVQSFKGAGGRVLRANTIYRSGELSRLDAQDLSVIEDLHIKLVCDLRTPREQAEFVSRWPDRHTPARLDIEDRGDVSKTFELMVREPGEAGALAAMEALYRRKPRAYVQSLLPLFDTIVAGDSLPLLIHCHAGKDRTGFIIAMILSALGVSHEDIIEDYVTTAKYFLVEEEAKGLSAWAKRAFGLHVDAAAAIPMVDARRAYLEASFDEITKSWGNVDAYLQDSGLTADKRAQLQDTLLV
jgi:protein-tyrosine phosphatase